MQLAQLVLAAGKRRAAHVLLPASQRKGGKAVSGGLDLVEISRLHDLVDLLHDPGDDARIGRRVVAS